MVVKARLAQRYVTSETVCQICGGEVENIMHVFFNCNYAVDIWRYSDFGDLLNDAPADSFLMRWRWLREKINNADLLKIDALLWASWRCRNLHIFEHTQPNAVMLAANYSNWVADHMLYAAKLSCQPHRTAEGSIVLAATKSVASSTPECLERKLFVLH
uniref:Reverse transcriptase zinc-binding domain-containing protein n=1 Tax=Chenopodium quinoa TaxID=63459 RepID=A0A803N6G3_CHEQI